MAIRRIATTPDPVLRQKAHKVRAFNDDLQQLIDDMVETMRVAPGVGLAAPQVSVSRRVIIVEYGEGSEDPDTPSKPPKLRILVNPKITRESRQIETGSEACLSIPGYFGEVPRPISVTVEGQDRHGKSVKLKAKNWLGRIIQHEIDHLNGILFIDRAVDVWRIEQSSEKQLPPPAWPSSQSS
jgi:peptide deformylase